MSNINKIELSTYYSGADVATIWQGSQSLKVIDHPTLGKISPNYYRAIYHDRPCPFCGKKMVHGQSAHSTHSKQESVDRGYWYVNKNGNKIVNQIGNTYFHPHYVTLDHKLTKARCPEHMFDFENLQIMCWKCNQSKGDNNAFEIQHNSDYIQDLASQILDIYKVI
jgi:hypothetical protein